jgi:tRNA threonylcarbamoyl adenosine modification protein (Sua5/YciO/YrdC/YwlC family)
VRSRVIKVPRDGAIPAAVVTELEEAGRLVREGGLVAFPTETVYGIAVNLRDEDAMRRLQRLKGRPGDKPITVHLPDPEALGPYVREVPRAAWKLARHFWPGPLSIVMTDKMGRATGFRVPDHDACRLFLRAAACKVGGTSANVSGDVPASSADQVLEHFDGLVDIVIDGGPARHSEASTVVRTRDAESGGSVDILREGVIPAAEIREITAKLLLFVCTGNRCRSPLAEGFATNLVARRLGVDRSELHAAGYRIESAGTGCIRGQPATAEAVRAGLPRGVDLATHRSRPLTPTMLEDADDVFVMTTDQRRSILEFAPELAARVRLLDRGGKDIEDPFGLGDEVYAKAAERIHRALVERLDDL